jgi:hypothetical protein
MLSVTIKMMTMDSSTCSAICLHRFSAVVGPTLIPFSVSQLDHCPALCMENSPYALGIASPNNHIVSFLTDNFNLCVRRIKRKLVVLHMQRSKLSVSCSVCASADGGEGGLSKGNTLFIFLYLYVLMMQTTHLECLQPLHHIKFLKVFISHFHNLN